MISTSSVWQLLKTLSSDPHKRERVYFHMLELPYFVFMLHIGAEWITLLMCFLSSFFSAAAKDARLSVKKRVILTQMQVPLPR